MQDWYSQHRVWVQQPPRRSRGGAGVVLLVLLVLGGVGLIVAASVDGDYGSHRGSSRCGVA